MFFYSGKNWAKGQNVGRRRMFLQTSSIED